MPCENAPTEAHVGVLLRGAGKANVQNHMFRGTAWRPASRGAPDRKPVECAHDGMDSRIKIEPISQPAPRPTRVRKGLKRGGGCKEGQREYVALAGVAGTRPPDCL